MGEVYLAHDTQSSSFMSTDSPSKHISLPGSIMGTIHYMSPEQARGLPLDTRSDLFSAGVVLYEMLAGHRPFTGETSSDALVAILEHDPPPLAGERCKEQTELESLVSRLLHKDRNLRYQTAMQFSIDLD
jgi:serine/threonine protein kinase